MRYPRRCLCCNTTYEYCPSCYDYRNLPLWMNSFHNENCKNIFETCTNYNFKLITKEQAKKALSNYDLSNRASFSDCVKRDIDAIMTEENSTENFSFKKVKYSDKAE